MDILTTQEEINEFINSSFKKGLTECEFTTDMCNERGEFNSWVTLANPRVANSLNLNIVRENGEVVKDESNASTIKKNDDGTIGIKLFFVDNMFMSVIPSFYVLDIKINKYIINNRCWENEGRVAFRTCVDKDVLEQMFEKDTHISNFHIISDDTVTVEDSGDSGDGEEYYLFVIWVYVK